MTPRRVLLVSYHFPPSAAVAVHRMLGLVRYLPELGWQPVVIAPPRLPWEPEDRALLDQVPRGTPVCYVPFRSGGVINRVAAKVMPLLRWYPDAKKACARTIAEHEPAALITSSPPGCVHYLGLAVKRRHRLPWIACLRDPWVTNWARRSPAELEAALREKHGGPRHAARGRRGREHAAQPARAYRPPIPSRRQDGIDRERIRPRVVRRSAAAADDDGTP